MPIVFHTAGLTEPLNQTPSTEIPYSNTYDPRQNLTHKQVVPTPSNGGRDGEVKTGLEEFNMSSQDPVNTEKTSQHILFYYDIARSNHCQTQDKLSIDIPQRELTTDDSSSDEIILFRGRNKNTRKSPPREMDFVHSRHSPTLSDQESPDQLNEPEGAPVLDLGDMHIDVKLKQRGRARLCTPHGHGGCVRRRRNSDDDAMLADYISNLQEHGELGEVMQQNNHNRRELGNPETDVNDHAPPNAEEPKRSYFDASTPSGGCPPQSDDARCDILRATTFPFVGPADRREREVHDKVQDQTVAILPAGRRIGHNSSMSNVDAGSHDSASSLTAMNEAPRPRVCNEFDLMDWDRPSLRRKKGGGHKATRCFNDVESDLEEHLHVAWKSDRLRKKERKKQREALHTLGLIGKKNKSHNLGAKYPSGMTMQEVAEELKSFLIGSEPR
ncbi:hypothetical protein RJ55_07734 [Drechmeria coniospora]|nr:hypothetical protein RJ55_07734 [Drechmeria coniospora]